MYASAMMTQIEAFPTAELRRTLGMLSFEQRDARFLLSVLRDMEQPPTNERQLSIEIWTLIRINDAN